MTLRCSTYINLAMSTLLTYLRLRKSTNNYYTLLKASIQQQLNRQKTINTCTYMHVLTLGERKGG